MATDKGQKTGLYTAGNWTARKWFNSLAIFLLLWIGIYLLSHWGKVHSSYMNVRFSSEQIQEINRILYAKEEAPAVQKVVTTRVSTFKDTAAHAANDSLITPPPSVTTQYVTTYQDKCDDSARLKRAMLYIAGEFDNSIKPEQLNIIRQYISSFSAQEVGAFLVNLKLKVRSYFWLTGPMVYIEIVFWSIIGVLCSILFAVASSTRNAEDEPEFNPNEIPYHVAKLFYAPVCAIIIILCYNYIKHRNVVEVNTNEGMIVFSFVCGLFAGRMMSLLERVKDLLMPEDMFGSREPKMKPATVVPTTRQVRSSAPVEIAAPQQQMSAPVEPQMTDKERYAPTIYEYETMVDEVVIELRLDEDGLFREEKDELLANGFDNAVVTLHSVNGKDIINARKTGDKHIPLFLATNVDAGIYIVRCTLTQTLSDNYVINMFGEKTAYITKDSKEIELYIKKYEAQD